MSGLCGDGDLGLLMLCALLIGFPFSESFFGGAAGLPFSDGGFGAKFGFPWLMDGFGGATLLF